ncbi:MAG: hypothetical protein IK008_01135 [Bacteroidales bacterium]|nr:hypothetical protein [Bacteroidales bacterium]
MKKFLVVMAAVLGMAVVASAQPRAIGIRAGYGAELSYQHTLGGENFAELDLGWSAGAIQGGLAYDFIIAPLGPVNIYAGPQAFVGLANTTDADGNAKQGLWLGAGAQLGVEYLFDSIPLQLSLDWKPSLLIIPNLGFGWNSIALGIRYLF